MDSSPQVATAGAVDLGYALERRLFSGPASSAVAGLEAEKSPQLQIEHYYRLHLHHQYRVQSTPGERTRSFDDREIYAGWMRVRLSEHRRCLISVDSRLRVEMTGPGGPLMAVDYIHRRGCNDPRKIVRYDLPNNSDLYLHISGASARTIGLTLTYASVP